MDFVVMDVETSCSELASICSIGIVVFENGKIADVWQQLVNPEDFFSPINVAIHGITEDDVADAPTLPEVFPKVRSVLEDAPVVACHTHFDRTAIQLAVKRYGLQELQCTWIDTARVARRAWPEFSRKGYGLANITAVLGISFRHHQPEEDARAAGEVFLRAIRESGLNVADWLVRVERPISPGREHATRTHRDGNPDGLLAGEVITFTGSLSLPREQSIDMACAAGCSFSPNVTKSTTILVVGDQDIRKLAGEKKSSKHRKAEKLLAGGQEIKIIKESDFSHLIAMAER